MRLLILILIAFPLLSQVVERHRFLRLTGSTRLVQGQTLTREFIFHWLRGGAFTDINYPSKLVTCPDCNFAASAVVWFWAEGGDFPIDYMFPGVFIARKPLADGATDDQYRFGAEAGSGCGGLVSDPGGIEPCYNFTEPAPGTTLYAGVRFLNETTVGHSILFTSITGLPTGVTAQLVYAGGGSLHSHASCGSFQGGACRNYGSNTPTWIIFTASSSATIGSATVTVNFTTTGSSYSSIDVPIEVVAPTTITRNTPQTAPALPVSKNLLDNSLVAYAKRWCDESNPYSKVYTPFSPIQESTVQVSEWYYDGSRNFLRIANMFNLPLTRQCGENIMNQYQGYINGTVQTERWRTYTRGFVDWLNYTRDQRYVTTIKRSLNWATNGTISDPSLRELSFTLLNYATVSKMQMSAHANLYPAAERLLNVAETNYHGGNNLLHQTFMDGLLFTALKEYWEFTMMMRNEDKRVPQALKWMGDLYIADGLWDLDTGLLMYNPEPRGLKCQNGCQEWNGESHGLIMGAFAWLWWYYGDEDYLEIADSMFKYFPFYATYQTNNTTSRIEIPNHGFAENDEFRTIMSINPTTGNLGFDQHSSVYQATTWYVKNVTPNDFQVSSTSGGSAITFATDTLNGRGPLVSHKRGGMATGDWLNWWAGPSEKGKNWNQFLWGMWDYLEIRTLKYNNRF